MAQLLIVDDEAHVINRLATLVEWSRAGVSAVYTAQSANEAIALMHEQSIDVVMTDIRMPGMNGLQLSALITRKWKMTRCILFSGHADFEYAKEAIQQGVSAYLLKPVTDEELLEVVSGVVSKLKDEWEQVISQQQIERTMRENLPQLRANLLSGLIQGKQFARADLRNQMSMLDLDHFYRRWFCLLLVRLEDPFYLYDSHRLTLIEFSVCNMAEELFAPSFQIWHGKDTHDDLVFAVTAAASSDGAEANQACDEEEFLEQIVQCASMLQSAIHTYLNGNATIMISRVGSFPDDLSVQYDRLLRTLRNRGVAGQDLILIDTRETDEQQQMYNIPSLYELPTLPQLLEAAQWEDTFERMGRIIDALANIQGDSQELMLEVFLTVSSAITYYAHKSGRPLSTLIGPYYEMILDGSPCRSIQHLRDWSFGTIELLRSRNEDEAKDSRANLINEVQQFVERELSNDVSLIAISQHVYMHPVYISKIYKLETGENLSDYVQRIRMEKASHLLLHSQDRIYEIAAQIGYQRAHSFIHAFKKYAGYTPQEYRDKFGSGNGR